jgi:hypothetical protein
MFNPEHDWPAPGWSLGFGKMVRAGSQAAELEDADGTAHTFSGTVNSYNSFTTFVDHTTDGTQIDYTAIVDNNTGGLISGAATYSNGTVIAYGAPRSNNVLFPIQITDANGNYIKIAYRNNIGPEIDAIQDTLGRTLNFYYYYPQFGAPLLSAITAPGLSGSTRTIIRLHYSYRQVFPPPPCASCQILAAEGSWMIDAIYFPGSSTGYWFGEPDSYTAYGMIQKVSARSGMTLQASSLTDQGMISAGKLTRERVYTFSRDIKYNSPPTYTQWSETWAGMDVNPANTTFSVQMDATPRRVDKTLPDGTRIIKKMWNSPGQFYDGLPFLQLTYDDYGKVLRQIWTIWELGDYESPRFNRLLINQNGLNTMETFGYCVPGMYSCSLTNQMVEVLQWDYDLSHVIGRHHIDYETDPGYADRHIFNLPKVDLAYTPEGQVASHTEYAYDHQPLVDTPGVVSHSDAANPYAANYWVPPDDYLDCEDEAGKRPRCHKVHEPGYWATPYQQSTDFRGNVTQTTRYADPINLTGPVEEARRYDIDGNVVTIARAASEQTSFTYNLDSKFAYPSAITRGDPNSNSSTRITQTFKYDFDTGLRTESTDYRGTTASLFDPSSLRLSEIDLPTGARITYGYDDQNLAKGQAVWEPTSELNGQSCEWPQGRFCLVLGRVTLLNGLGLIRREDVLSENGWNAVARQYDNRGRPWKRSQPFLEGEQPIWNEVNYDALDRITSLKSAKGSQLLAFYDEPTRPSSASNLAGETMRVIGSGGQQRWLRTNALRELAEVVEPAPYGGGLSAPNSIVTRYTYNALHLLTRVNNGPNRQGQERVFAYDGLGRMVAEYLPEKSATLDDSGNYVGQPGGLWSDVFTYDNRSNLTSHTDARGVVTVYDYANDPLNRVQHVSYSPAADTSIATTLLGATPVSTHWTRGLSISN